MHKEWLVYNLCVKSQTVFEELVEIMSLFAENLRRKGQLDDYYYNKYFIPPEVGPYVRFGFYKPENKEEIDARIRELIKEDQIIKAETVEPDLGNVDGVEMDKIKLTARKITEIVKKDFGKRITTSQAANLIHLSMNHFFGYIDEREIYSGLTESMNRALKDIEDGKSQ